jgi:hypothetical protein
MAKARKVKLGRKIEGGETERSGRWLADGRCIWCDRELPPGYMKAVEAWEAGRRANKEGR